MHGGACVSNRHCDGKEVRSRVWGQAVQYIDEVPAEKVVCRPEAMNMPMLLQAGGEGAGCADLCAQVASWRL